MMASRPSCPLSCLSQADLDTLLGAGVSPMTLVRPESMMVARGQKAHDGLFEPDPSGDRWYAFEVADADDIVFWQIEGGDMCCWTGRAFALGEEIIDEASTYSFDHALNIFESPLDWLRADRDGIVVVPDRWQFAFDRLRDVPRIAVAEEVLPLYRRYMKPAHMPEVFVLRGPRRPAA